MSDYGEHTPEPWKARTEWKGMARIAVEGPMPKDCYEIALLQDFPRAHANARRIVACVNACVGIPTEELERGVIKKGELVSALEDLIRLTKEHEVTIDCEWGPGRCLEEMEKDAAFSGEIYKAEAAIKKAGLPPRK